MSAPVRTLARTWIGLLALLALTASSSLLPMGAFNLVINLAVALAKALLVLYFFMHLSRGSSMVRVAALAGVVWLALLAGLSLTDFLWRPL